MHSPGPRIRGGPGGQKFMSSLGSCDGLWVRNIPVLIHVLDLHNYAGVVIIQVLQV